ncbi:MAG: DUF4412 domain-containing protein [Verrucomicrobiae bacterium]|nr:DUF4412 domain-containing protein [Verrucomicrobiae bacterium]
MKNNGIFFSFTGCYDSGMRFDILTPVVSKTVGICRAMICAAVLWLAMAARADLTLLQEVENYQGDKLSQKEQMMVQVSGKHLRFDVGQMMTSIILNDRKLTFSISHEARQYVVMRHDAAGAKGAGLPPQGEEPLWQNATIEATGVTESVSGFACKQVVVREKPGYWTELWLAESAIDLKRYFDEFQFFSEFNMSQILTEVQKRPQLKGFPIRISQFENSKLKFRSTVKRLDTAKISMDAFETPAGYEELKMEQPPAPQPTGRKTSGK